MHIYAMLSEAKYDESGLIPYGVFSSTVASMHNSLVGFVTAEAEAEEKERRDADDFGKVAGYSMMEFQNAVTAALEGADVAENGGNRMGYTSKEVLIQALRGVIPEISDSDVTAMMNLTVHMKAENVYAYSDVIQYGFRLMQALGNIRN